MAQLLHEGRSNQGDQHHGAHNRGRQSKRSQPAFGRRSNEKRIKFSSNLKGVDWQKFTEGMDAALSSFDESDSLKTDVNCFYDLLYEQLDRIAPRRARKP